MNGKTEAVIVAVLIVLALTAFVWLARSRWGWGKKRRIRILPPEPVRVLKPADPVPCPACGIVFRDDDEVARCEVNTAHAIHKACTTMMHNKCPICGGKVE
jgi:hypothetical protein